MKQMIMNQMGILLLLMVVVIAAGFTYVMFNSISTANPETLRVINSLTSTGIVVFVTLFLTIGLLRD